MATIPLQLAQRRLDTGNAVSYPSGSPVGAAMQGFGDELSAVAERFRQQKQQQEAFDAEIVCRQFDGQIAQAEAEAVRNAPADGSGLHDTMYGQVDPRSGQVIQSGLFDTLFDGTLPKIPEGQRANFSKRREVLRAAGSARMAAQQQARRDQYEQAEWSKVENIYTGSIAQSDPVDTGTFEAIRQSGLDLIAKIGNPLARQAAEMAWRSNTAKALVQAMIAQDPKRAAGMLGAGPVATDGIGETVRAAGGASPWAKDVRAAAKDDRLGRLTPDERVAQAFQNDNSARSGSKQDGVATDPRADLSPDDVQKLVDQANTATAAQLVDARTNVDLASQNAPAAIASTGTYPERMPGPEDFIAVYGAEEGPRRLQAFNITADVGRQVFDMRPVPNQAIHARLRDAEPGPDSSPENRVRYETTAAAAGLIMGFRRADPGGYVSQLFPNLGANWEEVSSPKDYQAAIARSVAAQQEMGFDNIQPLPQSVAEDLAKKYNDESTPRRQRVTTLSEIFLAVRDPALRATMAGQVLRYGLSQIGQNAANNPNVTSADVQAQAEALTADLSAIAQNPARARYDAMPLLLQPLVAADDVVRLMANGMTIGHADKVSAGLGSLFSSKSYEELLAAERAATEDAKDRAGSAAIPAELLGAAFAGHGLASAGITLTSRFGTAAMEGLSGLAARTALMSGEGALYGAAYAHGQDQDILSGASAGALWGAGGNVLAEGLGAISRQVAAKLTRRSVTVEPGAAPETAHSAVSPDASVPPVYEAIPGQPAPERFHAPISNLAFENSLLAAMLARDSSTVKYAGATLGWSTLKDYRKTFYRRNPNIKKSENIVHHAGEKQSRVRYSGIAALEEINSFENLRGIPKKWDRILHKKVIRYEWDEFYRIHPGPTRQQWIDKITDIDKKYGHLFNPPIGE